MFNPKERLEQIRKSKTQKEQPSAFAPQHSPPLFQPQTHENYDQNQLFSRLSKLENTVNELSSQLNVSKQAVNSLRRQNSQLETKVLKLEYQNSQLKVTNRSIVDRQTDSAGRDSGRDREKEKVSRVSREEQSGSRTESRQTSYNEALLPQVEESIQQIKKEPLENILHRKQKNFRALRVDPRQVAGGNKTLRQFANICKDYGKTLKKPILVLKLQAQDFE